MKQCNTHKIAAIITEYMPLLHTNVMVTNFLNGFPTDEGLITPSFASNLLDPILQARVSFPEVIIEQRYIKLIRL